MSVPFRLFLALLENDGFGGGGPFFLFFGTSGITFWWCHLTLNGCHFFGGLRCGRCQLTPSCRNAEKLFGGSGEATIQGPGLLARRPSFVGTDYPSVSDGRGDFFVPTSPAWCHLHQSMPGRWSASSVGDTRPWHRVLGMSSFQASGKRWVGRFLATPEYLGG